MQDGDPPNIATSVQQVLQQHFIDRDIARNFAVSWIKNSPRLHSDDSEIISNLRYIHQIPGIFQNWEMTLNGKFFNFFLPWYVRHCYRQSPECNALSSTMVGTLKTCNSNKICFLSSRLISLLLHDAFLCKCFTPPIHAIRVSFYCYLRFFHDLINLRAKKWLLFESFEILLL